MKGFEFLDKLDKDDLKNILLSISKKESNPDKWLESKVIKYLDKKICSCYGTRMETVYLYNRYTGQPEVATSKEVGFCRGTKECDICNCKGNKNNCDFY